MKLLPLLLPLLPATLAAECTRFAGCAGCGTVASVSFTAKGDVSTATAANWGSMSFSPKTISVKNTSKQWALFCVYGTICVPLEAGDSCTTAREANENPSLGLQVWAK